MTFDILNIISLIFFTLEIILSTLSKPGYQFSFFFWLDIVSSASIILDIQLVNSYIFNVKAASTASLARAGRASRIGTK